MMFSVDVGGMLERVRTSRRWGLLLVTLCRVILIRANDVDF